MLGLVLAPTRELAIQIRDESCGTCAPSKRGALRLPLRRTAH